MNFRLVATVPQKTLSGVLYDHTIWMGEFNGLEYSKEEAMAFARDKLGWECLIRAEEPPTILH